ncbi:hypothetical protein EDC01DRAFT_636913 [Geopyxis carbonaria]|nr:hypothetical protein EDC01DRAFT_636913 [Geopyxis carbonaria]
MGNQLSTLYERLSFHLPDDWGITLFVGFIVTFVFIAFMDEQTIVSIVTIFNFQTTNVEKDNEGQDPAKLDAHGSTKENSATVTQKTSNESKVLQSWADRLPGSILCQVDESKKTETRRPLLLDEITRGVNDLELKD